MNSDFSEEKYEKAILELFQDVLGYHVECGYDINRDYENPLYIPVLEDCLRSINRDVPSEAIDEAILRLQDFGLGNLGLYSQRTLLGTCSKFPSTGREEWASPRLLRTSPISFPRGV